ncbi:LysR family transcriptional regulator [Oceanibaculum nanhaiense]|jgi:DNA-binding transcriptional LysR family regulator|uniref:LysR family transcriptional regulator n=1 Tax=Oceanibaculum nanhaiense TaxID=1909734 RepID=UPI000A35E62F|nr:LysR family transcriptional regulator [Oceanibaculum nanhaiense]
MRLANTDIRALHVFQAIVEHGGFAGAEISLGLTQSALSLHLKKLEERLGFTLCQRGRRGFQLTDRGAVVYRQARLILAELDSFEESLSELRRRVTGKLRIGLVDNTVSNYDFPISEAISAFLKKMPEAEIEVVVDIPEHLETEVANNNLHLALGPIIYHREGLQYRQFYVEKHSLYCGRRHPLFLHPDDEPKLSVLRQHPLVVRSYGGDEELGIIKNALVGSRVSSMEAAAHLILSGSFIGFLPDHYARRWLQVGEMRNLSGSDLALHTGFFIITRTSRQKQPLRDKFMQELVAILNRRLHEG